jgi:hypothetical protein
VDGATVVGGAAVVGVEVGVAVVVDGWVLGTGVVGPGAPCVPAAPVVDGAPVVGVVAVTRTSWATYSGQPPGNATGLLAGKSYNTILAENYSWQKLIDGVPVATGKGAAHEVAFAQPGTHAVADAWSES